MQIEVLAKTEVLEETAPESVPRVLLNVGCGPKKGIQELPGQWLEWREIRVDVDHHAKPDIVASMTDLSAIEDGIAGAVYCAGAIEHIFFHEVHAALKEFYRVLAPGGSVFLTTVDLLAVLESVKTIGLTGHAYRALSGDIMPMDMIFGYGLAIAAGYPDWQHRCGFTKDLLEEKLAEAGFDSVKVWDSSSPVIAELKLAPFALVARAYKN